MIILGLNMSLLARNPRNITRFGFIGLKGTSGLFFRRFLAESGPKNPSQPNQEWWRTQRKLRDADSLERPLPRVRNRFRTAIIVGIALASWAGSMLIYNNFAKVHNPMFFGIVSDLRQSKTAEQYLGENIEAVTLISGRDFPWIKGPLNNRRGIADVEFQVSGEKAKGTVIFKSKRVSYREWDCEEFSVILSDGTKINVKE